MRAWLVLLMLSLLALPSAAAQTSASPIQGSYDQVYVVTGRAIDANGRPFAGGHLEVELQQSGVAQAAPLVATANCKGDFITSFNLLGPSATGKVRITAIAPEGGKNGTVTVPLEPFWRRSDALVQLGSAYDAECPGDQNVFDSSVSLSARLLNRTDPYKVGEHEFQARPYRGIVRMRYEDANGVVTCPPQANAPPGVCEIFSPDERGDLRYTFVTERPFQAGGRVVLIFDNGTSAAIAVDPLYRIATEKLEMTGRGAPVYDRDAPGVDAPWALALVGLAALASRSLLQRRRG